MLSENQGASMKPHPPNPFPIGGYAGPEFFCDREKETDGMVSALLNRRNVSLVSPRRVGKSGLIHHVFDRISKTEKNAACFYIDIFPTRDLSDFTRMIARAALGRLDSSAASALKTIGRAFRSLSPVFAIDPDSGSPTVSFEMRRDKAAAGLDEVFDYLRGSKRRCFIAIDEFQQILEYPEKGVEALLRSHAQRLPNVSFAFAGSRQHLMSAMFSSANRPFYQSAQKLWLREIPCEAWRPFAAALFAKRGGKLPEEVFDALYASVMGHTWYAQFLLNRLFALGKRECAMEDFRHVLSETIREGEAEYKTYCGLLANGQLRCLEAIAKDGPIHAPFSGTFMKRHDFKALSSVRRALSALTEKMLVTRDENGAYSVADKFFAIWLARAGT
jgi:tetratricopeptide (TPR) repeat protein